MIVSWFYALLMHLLDIEFEATIIILYVMVRTTSSLFHTGITVGFTSTSYTVVEDGIISVCALRLNGSLTRPLSVTFTPLTMEESAGNATCMSVFSSYT